LLSVIAKALKRGFPIASRQPAIQKPWIFNVVQRNDHAKKSASMTVGMGVRYDAALRIQAEREAICYPQAPPVAKSLARNRKAAHIVCRFLRLRPS
jgi:hypothetical protein